MRLEPTIAGDKELIDIEELVQASWLPVLEADTELKGPPPARKPSKQVKLVKPRIGPAPRKREEKP